jgi:hypothetical protein
MSDAPPMHLGVSHQYVLMSDGILAGFGGLSTSFDSVAPLPPDSGGHWYRGRFENINVMFVDGRIELRKRGQIKARYNNSWNNHLAWY